MNNTESLISPLSLTTAGDNEFSDEALITAKHASRLLNLPLYYFTHVLKRVELGLPYYRLNRLFRYRAGELHRWQLDQAAWMQAQEATALEVGGAHA